MLDKEHTQAVAADSNDKQLIFKNCVSFNDCNSKINDTQVDNAKELDVVMSMYNVVEYTNNYTKTSGSLWQYCRNEPNDNMTHEAESFNKFRSKCKINAGNVGTANVEIVVTLKYLISFWKILEIPLINCETNLIFFLSENCVICEMDRATTFKTKDTKFFVPVIILSTQNNKKLLQKLLSGFKRTINWVSINQNQKHKPKISI